MSIPDDAEILRHIAGFLDVDVDLCTASTSIESLVTSSFQLVELVVDLQNAFDSMFGQAELRTTQTLGDLAAVVQGGMAAGSQDGVVR